MKQLLLPSAKDSSSNVRKWREDLAIALALEEAKVSQELREGTPRNLPLLSVEPGPNPPVAADYPLTVIGRAQYDTAVKARNEQVKDWNASNKDANTKLEKYIRSVAFILSTLSPPFLSQLQTTSEAARLAITASDPLGLYNAIIAFATTSESGGSLYTKLFAQICAISKIHSSCDKSDLVASSLHIENSMKDLFTTTAAITAVVGGQARAASLLRIQSLDPTLYLDLRTRWLPLARLDSTSHQFPSTVTDVTIQAGMIRQEQGQGKHHARPEPSQVNFASHGTKLTGNVTACEYCGNSGHTREQCHKRQNDEARHSSEHAGGGGRGRGRGGGGGRNSGRGGGGGRGGGRGGRGGGRGGGGGRGPAKASQPANKWSRNNSVRFDTLTIGDDDFDADDFPYAGTVRRDVDLELDPMLTSHVSAVRTNHTNRPRITYDGGAQLTIWKGIAGLTDVRRETTNVIGVGGRQKYTKTGYSVLLASRVVISEDALTLNTLVSTATIEVAYNLGSIDLEQAGKDRAGYEIKRISRVVFNHRAAHAPDLVFIRHTSGINADLLVLQDEQDISDADHVGQDF